MSTIFSQRNMSMVRSHSCSNSKVIQKKRRKSKVREKYFHDSENGSDASGRSPTPSEPGFSDDNSYSTEYNSDEEPLFTKIKRRNVSHDRKHVAQVNNVSLPEQEDQKEYVVERIVDMKIKAGKKHFFVKWLNYDSEDNTWEPEENMRGCKEMTKKFLKKRLKKSNSHAINNGNRARREDQNLFLKINTHPNEFVQDNSASGSSTELCNSPPHIEEDYLQLPRQGNLFYFRIVNAGEINFIYIDTTQSLEEVDDTSYKCIVTEDLTGKQPKLIYGVTSSIDGEKFCLVEFEGYCYVEVVPPEILFGKFPTFRKFFEVHCPHLFAAEQ